jgi:peptide-methionine (S)-S-oxide reductase
MKIFLFAILFLQSAAVLAKTETAYFAGGCFWCVEQAFENSGEILSARSGYSGGALKDPSYEAVSSGQSGHLEALEVTYDPAKTSLEKLLDIFWVNIDPFDAKGQFCDKGEQYQSAFFYKNEAEKKVFEKSKKNLPKKLKIKGTVATRLIPFEKFYPAEDYHQSYYKKNPLRYNSYKYGCGREQRLKEIWGAKK